MSYKLNKKICKNGLKNNPNKNLRAINYVTIHNTGNYSKTATALNHADFLYNGSGGKQTSWHYTVDKDEAWQSFEDNRACWHAGDNSGNGNMESIAIEICVNDSDGFKAACGVAAELTASLLKKHGLSIDRVVQHNKWSGKDCPKELRSGVWGVDWEGFINSVKAFMKSDGTGGGGSGEVMPPPKSTEPSAWAKESWDWGKGKGITDGSDPKGVATREQVVMMINNAFGVK